MSTPLLYGAHGEVLLERPSDDEIVIPEDFDPHDGQPGVTCRICGCSDDDGCFPNGCFWVAPALCSSCCQPLAEAWTVAPELARLVASQLVLDAEP